MIRPLQKSRNWLTTEENAWTVFALLAAIAGAAAGRGLLKMSWHAATGANPPQNPDDEEVTWRESLMWGLVSGAIIGAIRVASRRGAASAWKRWFTQRFD